MKPTCIWWTWLNQYSLYCQKSVRYPVFPWYSQNETTKSGIVAFHAYQQLFNTDFGCWHDEPAAKMFLWFSEVKCWVCPAHIALYCPDLIFLRSDLSLSLNLIAPPLYHSHIIYPHATQAINPHLPSLTSIYHMVYTCLIITEIYNQQNNMYN